MGIAGENTQNRFTPTVTKSGDSNGALVDLMGASFESDFIRHRDGSSSSTIVDEQSLSNRQSQVSFDDSTKTGSSSSSEEFSDQEPPSRKKSAKSHSFKHALKSKTLGLKGKMKKKKNDRPKSMPESGLQSTKPDRGSGLFKRAKAARSKQSGTRTYQEIDESFDYFAVTPEIPKDQVEAAVEKTPKGWWVCLQSFEKTFLQTGFATAQLAQA